MTADEVRLEVLAQVLVLGAAVAEARRRVEEMTLAEGVGVPSMSQCYRMVRAAKRDGTAAKVRTAWKAATSRRRADADAAKRAEAIRLIVSQRMSRRAVAETLGVHYNTVTNWLNTPDGMAALHTEARVSTLLGAMSLDADIAALRRIADQLEAEGELVASAQVRGKAADVEVKRMNGAVKVIVDTQVQVANIGAAESGKVDVLAAGLAQVAAAMGTRAAGVIDVEEVE
jgi:transposase-like protein